MLAHRQAPPVPVVEITEHADPLRRGRPGYEQESCDALRLARIGAEKLIGVPVVALGEDLAIEIADQRREGVGVVHSLLAVVVADA